jgi:hypothetical protein
MRTTLMSATFLLLLAHPTYAQDGAHGKSVVVDAPGEMVSYDLRGGNGSRGRDGSDGHSGSCNTYTDDEGVEREDYRRGGDGEDGGRGGNGGNGGNITIIFDDINDLKNIYVYAPGGHGGSGGNGGDGGWGCPSGSDGRTGSHGSDGKIGRLYIVPAIHRPYRPDSSSLYVTVAELMIGKKLVKQIWSNWEGAKDLLAPQSVISDSYSYLETYQYGSAQVVLKDETLIDKRLLEDKIWANLNEHVAKITFPNHIASFSHSTPSPAAILVLERFYRSSEFNSHKYRNIIGTIGQRKIFIETAVDLVPRPELILNLKVELKGRFFKYHQLYEGSIEQQFITKVPKGYLIELDKLPLSQSIPRKGKVRLTMNHQLRELELKSNKKEEIWVVKLNN